MQYYIYVYLALKFKFAIILDLLVNNLSHCQGAINKYIYKGRFTPVHLFHNSYAIQNISKVLCVSCLHFYYANSNMIFNHYGYFTFHSITKVNSNFIILYKHLDQVVLIQHNCDTDTAAKEGYTVSYERRNVWKKNSMEHDRRTQKTTYYWKAPAVKAPELKKHTFWLLLLQFWIFYLILTLPFT